MVRVRSTQGAKDEAASSHRTTNGKKLKRKSSTSGGPGGALKRAKNVHFDKDANSQLLSEERASHAKPSGKDKSKGTAAARINQHATHSAHTHQKKKPTGVIVPSLERPEETLCPTPQELAELAEDRMVIEKLRQLRASITSFSDMYFNFNVKGPVEQAFANGPIELITYVGCVAMGGPSGIQGWWQLIEDPLLRKAVVYGIISRVLHEHVISSLYFGASDTLIGKLDAMEKAHVNEDGFYRAEQRADAINSQITSYSDLQNMDTATSRVSLQLARLLQPIRQLDYLHFDSDKLDEDNADYMSKVNALVLYAQQLNLGIRTNGGAVYYFEPVFKDDEFDVFSMTCTNVKEMQNTCPYSGMDAEGNMTEPHDPRGDESDKALVRVVCSLGCVAYRKGGGELGKRLLLEDEGTEDFSIPPEMRSKKSKNEFYGRIITEKDGFRSKKIAKSVVALRWGKPQFSEQPKFRENYIELMDIMDDGGDPACLMM